MSLPNNGSHFQSAGLFLLEVPFRSWWLCMIMKVTGGVKEFASLCEVTGWSWRTLHATGLLNIWIHCYQEITLAIQTRNSQHGLLFLTISCSHNLSQKRWCFFYGVRVTVLSANGSLKDTTTQFCAGKDLIQVGTKSV
jgi:hypothetical protein